MRLSELIDNKTVRRLIPNVIAEVDDETRLHDKLLPFITAAEEWLSANVTGEGDFLSPSLVDLSVRIIVNRAFSCAVPSLDLVLSPTGFGIVNTTSIAPASKERVERLIASLRDCCEASLRVLVAECRKSKEWRDSPQGRYFCATFFSSLDDIARLPLSKERTDILQDYAHYRDAAMAFEDILSEKFLGAHTTAFLRDSYNDGTLPPSHEVVAAIRLAEARFIEYRTLHFTPFFNLWRGVQPIFHAMRYHPEIDGMWREEMKEAIDCKPFSNDIKGAFYF